MRTGSVRLRVSVAAMALVVLAVLLLDGVVLATFKMQGQRELRSRLATRAAITRTMVRDMPPEDVVDRVGGDGVTATLRDQREPGARAGRVPMQPPMSMRLPPNAARREQIRPRPGQGGYVATVDVPGNRSIELVAADTANQRAFGALLVILLSCSAALLGAAFLFVRWAVGTALRPLDDVVDTAGRIAAGDTSLRLHPQRSDTDLGRLATSFDRMVDELEGSARRERANAERMRTFLGDASHELRTPLAGVQASAETLLRDQPDRHDRERLAVGIVRDTTRLGRLVDDLLRITRLDAGFELRSNQQTVDVAAVARTEAERPRDLDVAVTADEDLPVVRGDADAVGRIIRNLLDNAALAAPGGRAWVTVAGRSSAPAGATHPRSATGGAAVTVTVDDDGPGVPDADRERIFERFTRLDKARSRDAGGSGLGLSISRDLAAGHGGSLVCTARPDGQPGARFVLTLPAVPLSSGPAGADPEPAPAPDWSNSESAPTPSGSHATEAAVTEEISDEITDAATAVTASSPGATPDSAAR